MTTTSSGLQYSIITEGSGPTAAEGDEVLIHESTSYRDGTLIFTTREGFGPLKVLIGGNQVIEGVDEGLRGMKTGEIRKLIVPPELSKRTQYPPSIHPDSILVYEIELLEVVE